MNVYDRAHHELLSGKAAKGRVTAVLCKSNLLGGASPLTSSWPHVVYMYVILKCPVFTTSIELLQNKSELRGNDG